MTFDSVQDDSAGLVIVLKAEYYQRIQNSYELQTNNRQNICYSFSELIFFIIFHERQIHVCLQPRANFWVAELLFVFHLLPTCLNLLIVFIDLLKLLITLHYNITNHVNKICIFIFIEFIEVKSTILVLLIPEIRSRKVTIRITFVLNDLTWCTAKENIYHKKV